VTPHIDLAAVEVQRDQFNPHGRQITHPSSSSESHFRSPVGAAARRGGILKC